MFRFVSLEMTRRRRIKNLDLGLMFDIFGVIFSLLES